MPVADLVLLCAGAEGPAAEARDFIGKCIDASCECVISTFQLWLFACVHLAALAIAMATVDVSYEARPLKQHQGMPYGIHCLVGNTTRLSLVGVSGQKVLLSGVISCPSRQVDRRTCE